MVHISMAINGGDRIHEVRLHDSFSRIITKGSSFEIRESLPRAFYI
jgi:hypothetical protein